MTFVDNKLETIFSKFSGMCLQFGDENDSKITITMPVGNGSIRQFTMQRVETAEEFDAIKDRFSKKANFPDSFSGVPGKHCMAFFDNDQDEKLDSYVTLTYTAYIVNNQKPTLCFDFTFLIGTDSFENSIFEFVSSEDIKRDYAIYLGKEENFGLPFYPEITETKN